MEYELDFVTNRANRDIQVRWITTNNHFAVARLRLKNTCSTFAWQSPDARHLAA